MGEVRIRTCHYVSFRNAREMFYFTLFSWLNRKFGRLQRNCCAKTIQQKYMMKQYICPNFERTNHGKEHYGLHNRCCTACKNDQRMLHKEDSRIKITSTLLKYCTSYTKFISATNFNFKYHHPCNRHTVISPIDYKQYRKE